MKINYFGPQPNDNQPRWDMRPESSEECRFLTILRDIAMRPGTFIRVTGTEDGERGRPGMPEKPVYAMSIVLVDQVNSKRAAPLGREADPTSPVVRQEPFVRVGRPQGDAEEMRAG